MILTIVNTSATCGTFFTTDFSFDRNVAARIGSEAFFAPLTSTVPSSLRPPSMTSLSMRLRYQNAVYAVQVLEEFERRVRAAVLPELRDLLCLAFADLDEKP